MNSSETLSNTSSPNWRGLHFFSAYRMVVATLLLGIHAFLQAQHELPAFSADNFDFFTLIAAIYALLALGMFAIDALRLGGFNPRYRSGLRSTLSFSPCWVRSMLRPSTTCTSSWSSTWPMPRFC